MELQYLGPCGPGFGAGGGCGRAARKGYCFGNGTAGRSEGNFSLLDMYFGLCKSRSHGTPRHRSPHTVMAQERPQ